MSKPFGESPQSATDSTHDRSQPLVSVITAVYNGESYIASCLESVLRQDYPNIEHLVLDGGSTDGTVEVLRRYDSRIAYWKSEPDEGIYYAWNKALSVARGEWICFLGVDDEFKDGAIGAYMELASLNPEAEYLSSMVDIVDAAGYVKTRGKPWTWNEFSRWMCTPQVGSMHRRSLYERFGAYNTDYRITADYEFLLRARERLRTAFMPVVTIMMRDGGMSCTLRALEEQAMAKVSAGGRSRLRTNMELYYAKMKYALRPIRYTIGGIKARRSAAVRRTA